MRVPGLSRRLGGLGLLTLGALLACEPAAHDHARPAAPAPGAGADTAKDLAPNANAAQYGAHGVAATPAPPDEAAAAPSEGLAPGSPGPEAAPGSAGSEAATAGAAGDDPQLTNLRGHACECGKSCHCGHCSGAVPGCHCHVKRTDEAP